MFTPSGKRKNRNIRVSMFMVIFASVFLASLFTFSGDMNGHATMSDCLFTSQSDTVCAMDMVAHITAWETAFMAIVVLGTFYIGRIRSVFYVSPFSFLSHIVPKQAPIDCSVLERSQCSIHKPFQELFSKGILHPKLFS